jgi:hypothetical protein
VLQYTKNDATHLISKVGLWKERKAIELKLESLNNKTLEKVAADKDAKYQKTTNQNTKNPTNSKKIRSKNLS